MIARHSNKELFNRSTCARNTLSVLVVISQPCYLIRLLHLYLNHTTTFYEVILPYSVISHLASKTPIKWPLYAFINLVLLQLLKSGPLISAITSKQMQHSSCPDCGMHLGFPWSHLFRQTLHLEMSWCKGLSFKILKEEWDVVILLAYKNPIFPNRLINEQTDELTFSMSRTD